MKKILIIVNTPYNLMLAIQLKQTLFDNEVVDLFLGRPSLHRIYEEGLLDNVFNNIYYENTLSHQQSLIGFFIPQYELNRICQSKPEAYTDIFFWNPDWIFYNYYKYLGKNCHLHVYADAIAGFTTDEPSGLPSTYGSSFHAKVLRFIDRLLWNVDFINTYNYDYYMFSPEYACFKTKRVITQIPAISKQSSSLIELYNKLWHYEEVSFKERYLYLDTGRDGYVTNEDVNESLQQLIDVVGIDNLLVKPHPAMNIEDYSIEGLHIMNTTMPFELICLNENISDKVLICISSGAAMLLPMCFDIHVHTISTILFENFHHDNKKEMLEIWNKLSAASELVHCPNTKEEFINIVKELES